MGGRTVLIVDGGRPVPLMNLPDTGAWGTLHWSRTATVRLTRGEHLLQWQNVKGGGLTLAAYALSDDPAWKPVTAASPSRRPASIWSSFRPPTSSALQGKQLSVSGTADGLAHRVPLCAGNVQALLGRDGRGGNPHLPVGLLPGVQGDRLAW